MTLTVTIKNSSGSKRATVKKLDLDENGEGRIRKGEDVNLAPGEQVDLTIHRALELVVSEEADG